ncbi:MAG TPA: thioredoxin family protein [Longimicrobiaceae bacterium]|nr:thioredoxin family protein [Longimicrobiaceae bacterium]
MQLVYLRADWCGVCHEKTPVAEEIARTMGVPLEMLDADREPEKARAEALRIRQVPTLALVDGDRIRFRLVGEMITADNVARLTEMTERTPPPA